MGPFTPKMMVECGYLFWGGSRGYIGACDPGASNKIPILQKECLVSRFHLSGAASKRKFDVV